MYCPSERRDDRTGCERRETRKQRGRDERGDRRHGATVAMKT